MKKFKSTIHFLRDVLVFLISSTGLACLRRLYLGSKGPLVRVICFHDVPDSKWFEEVISMLVKKYIVVTPEQFHQREFARDKINLLLTFDDGYKSWVEVALPSLAKHKVKALFFICSGLLDVEKRGEEEVNSFLKKRLLLKPRKVISWAEVRELVKSGHTIGGHTVSHPHLSRLSAAQIAEEISSDKEALEEGLGVELNDFAYPFGRISDYNQESTKQVVKAGYQHIYSAVSDFYNHRSDSVIPRTMVSTGQSKSLIKRWIGGSYDIVTALKNFIHGR